MDKKNDVPLVSVIMGIYNCADTLPKAVECIQNQTYRNWELIMCDDCSNDDTLDVANNLAAKDKRIKVIKNEKNLTLAPTLNKCLMYARGDYVARMDGDDTCCPTRFEKEYSFLRDHPEFDIVSCNMNLVDSEGVFGTIQYKEQPTLEDFIHANMHCHAAVMMRMAAIRDVKGYSEKKNRNRVEDYDLWIRMYSKGYKGYNIQETLYSMCDNRNAYNRRTLSNRINECLIIYEACKLGKANYRKYIYCIVPILKWLSPKFLYQFGRRLKHKRLIV